MKIVAIAALAAVCCVSFGQQHLYGVMYRTGGQTSGLNPYLYDIDPTTGAAANARAVNVNDCVGIAVSATGQMYGLTDSLGRINNQSGQLGKNLLFSIDPTTGFAQRIGNLDPNNLTGPSISEGDISFDPTTGTLWGISTVGGTGGQLFTVDTTTGQWTKGAFMGIPNGFVDADTSAMAFDANGNLWVLDTTFPSHSGPARLSRVDKNTGAINQTYVLNVAMGATAGMAFDPSGRLLMADGDFLSGAPGNQSTNTLYAMNFNTGLLDTVGNLGINVAGTLSGTAYTYTGVSGLAFGPAAVPEPSAFVGLGLGLLFVVRRRAKK